MPENTSTPALNKMKYQGEYEGANIATYCCNDCENAEGVGPDDPRSQLNEFSFDPETEVLTCGDCGSEDTFCEFENNGNDLDLSNPAP